MLGRDLTWLQAVGCLLIAACVPLTKLYDVWTLDNTVLTLGVVLTSQICAMLSTLASVSVEVREC